MNEKKEFSRSEAVRQRREQEHTKEMRRAAKAATRRVAAGRVFICIRAK